MGRHFGQPNPHWDTWCLVWRWFKVLCVQLQQKPQVHISKLGTVIGHKHTTAYYGNMSWLCWLSTWKYWGQQYIDAESITLNEPTNSFSFPIDLRFLHYPSVARPLHIFPIFENLSLPISRGLGRNCLIWSNLVPDQKGLASPLPYIKLMGLWVVLTVKNYEWVSCRSWVISGPQYGRLWKVKWETFVVIESTLILNMQKDREKRWAQLLFTITCLEASRRCIGFPNTLLSATNTALPQMKLTPDDFPF